jgi:tetratricopeptide (TPR) repeat protein
MTPERWEKIKGIFDTALSIPPEDRAGFVERECAGDDVAQREVLRLLEEYEKTRTFIDRPVVRLSYSLAPAEIISGRYRVVRPLGRGGMGEVYEVRDEMLSEAVALKTLRAELCDDPAFLKRFQTEIHLARKVTHPNVCRVFEVGVHEFPDSGRLPLYYFTMQLLEGETLSGRIHRAGRFGSAEGFPLIVQMAEGLQAAHSVGVIHRDFKSGNVMVTPGGAVVTDFGLAGLDPGRGAAAAALSGGDKLEGTVAYMSPEQMGGGEITPASDIYSLGIVLFEMATGRLPYEGRHIIQSAMQRVRGGTPSARALAPDLDPRWEMSIRRCLEPEPQKRFRSAADVADVFRGQRWRPPRLYWTRRRYALAAAGTATAAALGGTWWVQSRRPYQPKPEALTWYERGVEALRAVTYEAARRDLEKAVAIDPGYAPAYADLAAAYSELDASEQAKESILHAVSLAQDERLSERDALRVKAMQYVIARDFDRAQPLFERLVALAPDREKAGAYVDLAWLVQRRDGSPKMIPVLERAFMWNRDYAGAKLRMALALAQRDENEAARKLFEEAESLFQTASDYDGVVETLLQEAIALARAGRTSEAVAFIARGMSVASSTGDLHHEIRLQLALALAYRNAGEIGRSQDAVERGVKMAMENRMDQTAAVGLLDLGNVYSQRGEPEPAERYFRQGLEFATRSRALFSEARAQLALGGLFVQYNRPAEVAKFVRPALAFMRESGFRRESMQALLILGGAQDSLAEFDDSEKTLREAVGLAEEIANNNQTALARLYLGSVLEERGRWPESLEERTSGVSLFGDAPGSNPAFALLARGRLWARMGRFPEAEADLAGARARVEKLAGKQRQLRARLALAQAEIAGYQGRWADALRLARQALALDGGTDENLTAAILGGVAAIHGGMEEAGVSSCQHAIEQSLGKSRPYLAATGGLSVAEALFDGARAGRAATLAREALGFFEPRSIWEAVWRCYRILGEMEPARSAFDEVKRIWPPEMVRSYVARADLRKLAFA